MDNEIRSVDIANRLTEEMWDLLSTSFRIVQSGSSTGSVAFRKRAHRWMDDCRENGMPWLIVLAATGNLPDSETSAGLAAPKTLRNTSSLSK